MSVTPIDMVHQFANCDVVVEDAAAANFESVTTNLSSMLVQRWGC